MNYFEARNERWEEVRAYAMGEQNIERYKRLMTLPKRSLRSLRRSGVLKSPKTEEGGRVRNSKLIGIMKNSIHWTIQPIAARIKTYCMVKRLINKATV